MQQPSLSPYQPHNRPATATSQRQSLAHTGHPRYNPPVTQHPQQYTLPILTCNVAQEGSEEEVPESGDVPARASGDPTSTDPSSKTSDAGHARGAMAYPPASAWRERVRLSLARGHGASAWLSRPACCPAVLSDVVNGRQSTRLDFLFSLEFSCRPNKALQREGAGPHEGVCASFEHTRWARL